MMKLKGNRGQSLIEYALPFGMIVIVLAVASIAFNDILMSLFTGTINSDNNGGPIKAKKFATLTNPFAVLQNFDAARLDELMAAMTVQCVGAANACVPSYGDLETSGGMGNQEEVDRMAQYLLSALRAASIDSNISEDLKVKFRDLADLGLELSNTQLKLAAAIADGDIATATLFINAINGGSKTYIGGTCLLGATCITDPNNPSLIYSIMPANTTGSLMEQITNLQTAIMADPEYTAIDGASETMTAIFEALAMRTGSISILMSGTPPLTATYTTAEIDTFVTEVTGDGSYLTALISSIGLSGLADADASSYTSTVQADSSFSGDDPAIVQSAIEQLISELAAAMVADPEFQLDLSAGTYDLDAIAATAQSDADAAQLAADASAATVLTADNDASLAQADADASALLSTGAQSTADAAQLVSDADTLAYTTSQSSADAALLVSNTDATALATAEADLALDPANLTLIAARDAAQTTADASALVYTTAQSDADALQLTADASTLTSATAQSDANALQLISDADAANYAAFQLTADTAQATSDADALAATTAQTDADTAAADLAAFDTMTEDAFTAQLGTMSGADFTIAGKLQSEFLADTSLGQDLIDAAITQAVADNSYNELLTTVEAGTTSGDAQLIDAVMGVLVESPSTTADLQTYIDGGSIDVTAVDGASTFIIEEITTIEATADATAALETMAGATEASADKSCDTGKGKWYKKHCTEE